MYQAIWITQSISLVCEHVCLQKVKGLGITGGGYRSGENHGFNNSRASLQQDESRWMSWRLWKGLQEHVNPPYFESWLDIRFCFPVIVSSISESNWSNNYLREMAQLFCLFWQSHDHSLRWYSVILIWCFHQVDRFTLNPKSITMGELYGEFNQVQNYKLLSFACVECCAVVFNPWLMKSYYEKLNVDANHFLLTLCISVRWLWNGPTVLFRQ